MTYNLILVGNPNTGKTTLFNTMTNSFEKASNWHGVTVGTKTKKYKNGDDEFNITDIPGIYSLDAYSNEEKIAKDYLESHKDDLIINICDANNIRRNLALTIELVNAGYKIIVVANMKNETQPCDYGKLTKELGVIVLPIDARKKKDIVNLYSIIKNYATNYKTQNISKTTLNYNNLIKNNNIFYKNNPYAKSDKIDKIILNKFLFLPLFLLIIFGVFYLTFGDIGVFITDTINVLLNKSANLIKNCINLIKLPLFIQNFINEAIIDSCFSILSFLPQIIMLMFFINIIEDTGLMSRFAFMFDGVLSKVGLSGKSLFSLFMGYGCTTSAVITTRNLENSNQRKRVVSVLPFIPCSAKLPIFLVIASIFIKSNKYLMVFALYIFSIIISIIIALFSKIHFQSRDNFIIEMPKYRLPNITKILKDIFVIIKDFVLKIAKVVVFFSIIVWILQNLSTRLIYLNGNNFEESILYFLASKISFVFAPLGLDNVGVVVSLLLGLCAKELIVVGLGVINNVEPTLLALSESLSNPMSVCYFSLKSAIVFLVFILLYSPCISALSTIKNEMGSKFMFSQVLFQTIFAYVVCLILNMFLSGFALSNIIILGLIVVFSVLFVVKFSKQKKFICQGNCNACRKI